MLSLLLQSSHPWKQYASLFKVQSFFLWGEGQIFSLLHGILAVKFNCQLYFSSRKNPLFCASSSRLPCVYLYIHTFIFRLKCSQHLPPFLKGLFRTENRFYLFLFVCLFLCPWISDKYLET